MNRGWLIKRQFKIFTWHSVKATVLCNSTDTINSVPALGRAGNGAPAGLARTLPWRALGGLCRSSSPLSAASQSHRGTCAETATSDQGKGAFSTLSSLLLSFLLACVIPSLTVTTVWKGKNITLNFWAHSEGSGGRRGWGAWSWTGAGYWLSTEQCEHFLGRSFCSV